MPHPPHYQTISGGRRRGGEGPLSVRPFCLREEKKRREEMEGDVSPYKNGEERVLPPPPPPFPSFSSLVRPTVLLLLLLLFPPLFSSPFPPPPLGSGPREGGEEVSDFCAMVARRGGEGGKLGKGTDEERIGRKGGEIGSFGREKSLLSDGGEREKQRMNAKPGAAFRAHAMRGGPCCLVIASKGGNLGLRRGGKGTSVEKREREREPLLVDDQLSSPAIVPPSPPLPPFPFSSFLSPS